MTVHHGVEFESVLSVSARVPVDPHLLTPFLPAVLRLVEPAVVVQAGRYTSEACGDFCSASLSVPVARRTQVGSFPLVMLIDSEVAMLFGRERYGEPKRLARVSVEASPDFGAAVTVDVRRDDRALFKFRFTGTGNGQSGEATSHTFNLKTLRSASDAALGDTYLVSATIRGRVDRSSVGSLTVGSVCPGPLTDALSAAARDGAFASCTAGSIELGSVTEERLPDSICSSVHAARRRFIDNFVQTT